jgi:predicted transcriptional regulator
MPKRSRPPAQSTDPAARRRDVIFAVLGDPLRRRLLELMADGMPRHANGCARHLSKRISATIKHLGNLREAELVDTSPDPDDSRR